MKTIDSDEIARRLANPTPDMQKAWRQIEARSRNIEAAERDEAARIARIRRKKPVRPKAVT